MEKKNLVYVGIVIVLFIVAGYFIWNSTIYTTDELEGGTWDDGNLVRVRGEITADETQDGVGYVTLDDKITFKYAMSENFVFKVGQTATIGVEYHELNGESWWTVESGVYG